MFSLRNDRREEGFTVTELMVAAAIMVVLGGISLNVYLTQRKSAWNTAVQQDVSNAAMYIAQNQDSLKGHFTYASQNFATPIDEGIPGFKSSEGVELITYGSTNIGRNTSCIEGSHTNDTSAGRADTSWHLVIDQREMKKGKCIW